MHILFIADINDKSGASYSMYQTISELLRIDNSLKVSVVLPIHSCVKQWYLELGCEVYQVPYYPFLQSVPFQKWKFPVKYIIRGIQYLYGRLVAIRKLEDKIDMTTVDIVHSNSSREDFGAALARKYQKPICWHLREFGDLDFHRYSYRRNSIKLMNQVATAFIAISDAVQTHWIKKGLFPEKMVRIYNGVLDNEKIKKIYKTEDSQPLHFIMTGSLCETKGQMQLIEAIGILPKEIQKKIQVDLIGEGKKFYCRRLERRIEELGLNKIIYMKGYQKNITKKISEYDCGLMCSRSEGFGRVTVEYMMAGLPVIASDGGANPEIIRDNETGLLYHRDDTIDLANKIKIVTESPKLLERMGKKARQYAHKTFTVRINAEQILALYRNIMYS